MEEFVRKQKELLALEREAELEQTAQLLEGLPLRDLCQRGVGLQKLWISGSKTGLYGRTILTLCQRNSAEFPAHNITSGDIVGVIQQGGETLKPESSGVVLDVRPASIAVAFQEGSETGDIEDTQQMALVKLANDVTYRRLNNALDGMKEMHTSLLSNILLGLSEPSIPHQTFSPGILNKDDDVSFINLGLDSSQQDAVRFALKQRELGIIHGPPGTGKTTTVVEIIQQSVKSGEKVLVCAPSNIAVDNLLERLASAKLRCIRLGHPARVSGNLQKYSLDAVINSSDQSAIVRDIYKEIDEILKNNKKKNEGRGFREIKVLRKELKERERKVLKEILANAQVVLGTLTSSGRDGPLKHLPENHFSLTVIDECSQSLEMACWITVPWSPKLLLAGDHLQLPPTILSQKAAKGLELTLMERLITMYGDTVVRMLTTQYRMNKNIMEWSSNALYSGRVVAGAGVADHRLCDIPGVERSELTETVLLLVDTAGCQMQEFSTSDGVSKGNEGEASLVCLQVDKLVAAGVDPAQIAVIAPYNLQVETIRLNTRAKHPKLEVRSVDGYQGREKEVVIISLVRSNPAREVGFLAERRRLNVAVTRARRQVIVICDSETVGTDTFLREFLDYLTERGSIETADTYSDLPDVSRPEDSGLSSKKLEKKSEKKPKKKKENKASKQENVINPSLKSATFSRQTPEEKMAEEENIKSKFEIIVQEFISSADTRQDLPPDLNSNERRLIHEIADSQGLIHESTGDGLSRHIVLRKRNDPEPVADVKPNMVVSKKSAEICETPAESGTKKVDSVLCKTCSKEVPRTNIDLHVLRCKLKDDISIEKEKPKKSKKKEKIKSPEPEDFDSLCDQFQQMNKVCNFENCKAKVVIIGVNCNFCAKRFCLHHSMAEIHGCGAAVKLAARQQIARDHKLYPGSGTIPHTLDPVKRYQLKSKLDKKLNGLTDSRKPKKSDK